MLLKNVNQASPLKTLKVRLFFQKLSEENKVGKPYLTKFKTPKISAHPEMGL